MGSLSLYPHQIKYFYCNIGGFHGNDFSHWSCPLRNINIGYVEPDELVYDQTSRTYITAGRKFQSVKNAWFSLLKNEKYYLS